jgi:exopolyphosphatase / guanosine-5'-triphosphate,3'-diphosphate pyrophosphatase
LRYAAIDIGSNAVRLLIADIIEKDSEITFKKNTLIRVPLRLGDDAFLEKEISVRKADDLVKTMTAFKQLIDVYKVEDYMACATSAMREAQNGKQLVERIKKEAESLDKQKNYLYIDVGGGSTELSVFAEGQAQASRSFPLGTVRILDNADKEETWDEMKEWIKDYTKSYKNLIGIGTGGNINKLFRLCEEKEGTPLSISKLKGMYDYLCSFSLKERINVLNLNQDRADVIIPACEIYLTVMKYAGVKQIYVPRVGMVDGIINQLIERNLLKNAE